jgi:hypothetical protein
VLSSACKRQLLGLEVRGQAGAGVQLHMLHPPFPPFPLPHNTQRRPIETRTRSSAMADASSRGEDDGGRPSSQASRVSSPAVKARWAVLHGLAWLAWCRPSMGAGTGLHLGHGASDGVPSAAMPGPGTMHCTCTTRRIAQRAGCAGPPSSILMHTRHCRHYSSIPPVILGRRKTISELELKPSSAGAQLVASSSRR